MTLCSRALALASVSLLAGCVTTPRTPAPAAPVTVGIVGLNDFHGALEPPKQSVFLNNPGGEPIGVPAGGGAYLASAVDSVRAKYAHSMTVAAGDLISASQLASSIYLDEPAIGVLNRIGVDFAAVGNHEFDRGRAEILRIQQGGCEQHTSRKPCQIEPFTGARFRYLAASTRTESGATLFPATALKRFGSGAGQVTIGLIGLTLKGTPEIVSPDAIAGLTFADEAETINALVPGLKAQGADAIVVLLHQGGRITRESAPSGCDGLEGEVRPILDALDTRVDVVVSGHTHNAYVCDYGTYNPAKPILLTSAGVYGELVTDITLQIDPAANRVVAKSARNIIVQSEPYVASRGPVANTDAVPRFAPRADVAAYVGTYVTAAKVFAQRTVGTLAGPAGRTGSPLDINYGGPLGNLLADAQLAATRGAGAQIAFMNPFGIRAPLIPAANGSVTFAQIYAVQPFNNQLVTQTMTGAEIKAVLEQSFADSGPQQFLTPSAGFRYVVDTKAPAGQRIVFMTLDGKPLDPGASYRVTVANFLANGGDGYTAFTAGRDKVLGAVDVDALEAWLKASPARAVPTEERVTGR